MALGGHESDDVGLSDMRRRSRCCLWGRWSPGSRGRTPYEQHLGFDAGDI